MAKRDFKEIPKAAQPGQVPVGTAQVDIDKYITDLVKDPKVAQAAKQAYTTQTVQQNELQDVQIEEIKAKSNNPLSN